MGTAWRLGTGASAAQYGARARSDDRAGAALPRAGVPAGEGNRDESAGVAPERALFAHGNASERLVLELAQSYGAAADARLRGGLQHLYATGVAPSSRRFARGPSRGRTRPPALRRYRRGRLRLARLVHQRRHGEPGKSVRRGHRLQHADLGLSAPVLVVSRREKSSSGRSSPGLVILPGATCHAI